MSHISLFDNRYSLLYKVGSEKNVPARLVLQVSSEESLDSFQPLEVAMKRQLEINSDIATAYSVLRSLSLPNLSFSVTDFIMTYITLLSPELVEQSLEDINAFLNDENAAVLRDINELNFELEHWKESLQEQLEKDRKYVDYIVYLQETLAEVEPLPASGLEFNRVTVKASPTFLSKDENSAFLDGTLVGTDLGEEVFDQARVSFEVPLVLYTDHDGKTFSKVWAEFKAKSLIPNSPPPRNNIQVLLWTGLGDEKQTKESFTLARYDLNVPELTVDSPVRTGRNETLVLDRLSKTLPLEIGERTVARTGGDFRIYDIAIIQPIFLDMLLLFPIFYPYVYMSEESKAAYQKKKLTMHLRTLPLTENPELMPTDTTFPSSVAVTINFYSSNGEMMPVKDKGDMAIPSGTPYIICSITRANSSWDAKQFQEIFNRLCVIYLENYNNGPDSILSLYQEMFPKAEYVPKVRSKKKRKTGDRRLLQLQQLAPEIFVAGYARKCQGERQPLIITDDEVEDWRNKTFSYRGETLQRQIMRYPKDNPRYNFVCPSDNFPFVGVKHDNLENQGLYPYSPCCYGKDQIAPGTNSWYNEYFRGIKKKEKKTSAKTRIVTSKIVDFRRMGVLPNSLLSFISSFFEGRTDFIRMGVPRDTNSAISCLILATQTGNFNAKKIAARAKRVRENFSVYPSLLKQELYDLDDDEIMRQLKNNDLFFDPYYFYRALEETFNVNVVTFSVRTRDNVPIIEIPRNMYYHAQTLVERPIVLLYKNYGSESDALSYPQIELIGDAASSTYLFDIDTSKNMFNTLVRSQLVYIWNVESGPSLGQEVPYVDQVSIFGELQGQILDNYGKLRGVVTRSGLTVYIAPSQPLNLPEVKGGFNTLEQATEWFSEKPNFISVHASRVQGIWYSALNYPYTYFFPLKEPLLTLAEYTKRFGETEIGPSPPYPKQEGELQSYSSLVSMRNTILQLVSWIFILQGSDEDSFMRDYTQVGDEENYLYDFAGLPRILPQLSSAKEAINYLSTFSTFIKQGRIYLYNKRFAAGVSYFIRSLVKSYGQDLLRPREVYGIPYKQQIQTLLFDSWSQLQRWENEVSITSSLEVRTTLSSNLGSLKEPYFYLEDVLYLVQNVPDLNTALVVAAYWETERINPGSERISEQTEVPHRYYSIGPNGKLKLTHQDAEAMVSILGYDSGNFAALLPLS